MSFSNHLTPEKESLRDKLRSASFDNISTINNSSPKLTKRLSSPLTENKFKESKKRLHRKISKSSLDLSPRSSGSEKDGVGTQDFRKYLDVETSPRLRRNVSKDGETSPRSTRKQRVITQHRRSLDVPLFRCDSSTNNDLYDDVSSAYEDDADGPALADQQVEKLWKKIEKVKDNLIKLQAIKDENVSLYLKTTDNQGENGSNSKLKSNFERSNQKTNVTIQSLQKKLEKYQNQVKEIEDHGLHGGKKIIKVVQDHVRSRASSIQGHMVEQLESFNNFLKKDKKSLSMDHLTAVSGSQTVSDSTDDNKTNDLNFLSSDDETLPGAISNILRSGRKVSTPKRCVVSYDDEEIQAMRARVAILEKECELRKQNVDQFGDIMQRLMQSLQAEKFKTEQLQHRLSDLYNQWNDLTELHQNEMRAMTDELERTLERIECVEYRFTERSADLEEHVENLTTTCSKLEKQQHDQLLQPLEGYHNMNAKIFLSKCLCFVINIFLVLILVMSTIKKALTPFVSNRARLFASVISIMVLWCVWRFSGYETGISRYLRN